MNDKCREAFEAWYDGDLTRSQSRPAWYAHNRAHDCYMAWREAWGRATPKPVSRDGWLTEADIELLEMGLRPDTDDGGKTLRQMARAAIRMHAGQQALFTHLHAAIETCERGNV